MIAIGNVVREYYRIATAMSDVTADEFKSAREDAELTQDEAAELLGVSVWSLRGWEQGRRGVPREAYERLLLRGGTFKVIGTLRIEMGDGTVREIAVRERDVRSLISKLREMIS